MIMAQKPLLLKDYLELDSDSSGSGFQCAPRCAGAGATTLRRLLEAELRLCSADCAGGIDVNHVRRRPKNALAKFSAMLNAVRLLQFSHSSSSGGGDGRANASPSRIFRVGFWTKKRGQRLEDGEENSEKKQVAEIVRQLSFAAPESFGELPSLAFSSPDVSSWRNWSETTSSLFDNLPSTDNSCEYLDDIAAAISVPITEAGDVKEEDPTLPPSTGVAVVKSVKAGDGARAGKVMDGKEREILHSYGGTDKEQLSPISVMDFPCIEEEEEEESGDIKRDSSTSSRANLINVERNIKRFDFLDKLDPVNLQESFDDLEVDPTTAPRGHVTSANEAWEELDVMGVAWDLLEQLHVEVGPPGAGDIEKLLLAFFVQGLSCSHEINLGRPFGWCDRIALASACKRVPQELLSVARDWMGGNVEDCLRGTVAIREMEKDGRWRCFHEEEEIEIGQDLEGILLELLLEELVVDLRSFWNKFFF